MGKRNFDSFILELRQNIALFALRKPTVQMTSGQ
jgi:hypothetical protein